MSQSGAAKELGVSRQAVSNRLQEIRGKTTPGGLKYEFQSQKKNRSNKKQSEPTKIQKD
jgi:predicted transcriptional regulator